MMIRSVQGLGDFYRKSEVEFLGTEINFRFMTVEQLDKTIAESIALYNKLYPPKTSGFDKFMRQAIPIVVIGGAAVVSGGAILSAYGVGMGTAAGAVSSALTVSIGEGAVLTSIQSGATAIAAGGALYGKVTGDTPDDLIKVSKLIKSDNALDIMEKVAKDELAKKGVELQQGDKNSNNALRERLKKEQQVLSEKMVIAANKKAESLGQETPSSKKIKGMDIAVLATPFLLYFLG